MDILKLRLDYEVVTPIILSWERGVEINAALRRALEQLGLKFALSDYVIAPPLTSQTDYLSGDPLSFGVTLFGSEASRFPALLTAALALEADGLGQGHLTLEEVWAVQPYRGAAERLFSAWQQLAVMPSLLIKAEEVAAYAEQLSSSRLWLHFITPFAPAERKRPPRDSTLLRMLVRELLARMEVLWKIGRYPFDDLALVRAARKVRVRSSATERSDEEDYLSALGWAVEGTMELRGELTPLRELLAWGELTHVGSGATFGSGRYEIIDLRSHT